MLQIRRPTFAAAVLVLASAALALHPATATAQVAVGQVDEVFAALSSTHSPGCAVAVSRAGRPVLERAYGMADLEHDVPNRPETIMEPGSVAKQFTAAATILLALDGKLSLDDDVRKYIPELPDYGEPVTIRHLLNHTSGLRDWGSVAGIEGWPRTTRVHTHTHMLDITARQQSLNYRPGEFYSYTNTGYNLQAVLIERVSGMSFADFSRTRVFEPLGMTKTQWRDDFNRIVKDRAVAYSPTRDGGFRQNMPFENVHGNGGLLTTVGDLLKFTHNLQTGALWGPDFIREMHTQGVLNSGRTITYASGIVVDEYKGVRQVAHSGSTAGYRGYLARYPDQGLGVAVMCNVGNANAGAFAHQVADLYLGDALVAEAATSAPTAVTVPAAQLARYEGTYMRTRDKQRGVFSVVDGNLLFQGQRLVAVAPNRFAQGDAEIEFDASSGAGRPNGTYRTPDGDAFRMVPIDDFEPTAADLASYAGAYFSGEAQVNYEFEVRNGRLVRVDRYDEVAPLQPYTPDAFIGGGGIWTFQREGGRITSVVMSSARVWDLHFQRVR